MLGQPSLSWCARRSPWCALALVCGSLLTHAQAQRALDVQTFVPPAGSAAVLSIPEPELPPHGTVQIGLLTSYATSPLVRRVACDLSATQVDSSCLRGSADGHTDLVSDLGQVEASLAVALYDAMELGLVVPAAVVRVADDLGTPQALSTHAALGDLRLSAAMPVLRGGTAISLGFVASLPTGDGHSLVGARNWTAMPRLVLRQRIGATKLAAMLGYRLRERAVVASFEQDDELDLALGAAVPLFHAIDLRPELRARVGTGSGRTGRNENPVEGDLGVGLGPWNGASLVVGAGAGMWPGRAGLGAPALRVFALLRYTFEASSCAVRGSSEVLPQSGAAACPARDSDGDGVADDADACPNDPEDNDGFADGDGCPDVDDDADGLRDAVDRCPRASEDFDGFQDADGCPEADNDEDGIEDALDACAMDPEDLDGFEDSDGCPEPGPTPTAITVSEGRLLVSERIYFEYDRDSIRMVSAPVLDELAAAIRGLGPNVKVVVEGHTDDTGNADYNLDLSFRRARAVVEALHARGVPKEMLDFIGYGATRPLAPGDTPEGRELNRRVEFRLMR